jgi:hypothetical protein
VRINNWWPAELAECFRMETTGLDDLSVDLHAPELNGAGGDLWLEY